jgi:hypothetical protein
MLYIYRAIVGFLVWLSAEPGAVDLERPRAAAAVSAAMASLAKASPTPAPTPPAPKPDECCGECGGKGYLVMPDGHRVACPCPATCPCKPQKSPQKPAACPDGKCPAPGASPATAAPARPAGGR